MVYGHSSYLVLVSIAREERPTLVKGALPQVLGQPGC